MTNNCKRLDTPGLLFGTLPGYTPGLLFGLLPPPRVYPWPPLWYPPQVCPCMASSLVSSPLPGYTPGLLFGLLPSLLPPSSDSFFVRFSGPGLSIHTTPGGMIHQIMNLFITNQLISWETFLLSLTSSKVFYTSCSEVQCHRSCYNIPFGGSLVGSSKTPMALRGARFTSGRVWYHILLAISRVFPIPSPLRWQNGSWIVLALLLFSSTVLLNVLLT